MALVGDLLRPGRPCTCMLYAHFLAVLQVLVYAGAIMVLFVFVIMILNRDRGRAGRAVAALHRPRCIGVVAHRLPRRRGSSRSCSTYAPSAARTRRRAEFGTVAAGRRGAVHRVPVPVRGDVVCCCSSRSSAPSSSRDPACSTIRGGHRDHAAPRRASDATSADGAQSDGHERSLFNVPYATSSCSPRCCSSSARSACIMRRNALIILMSVELMLNAANMTLPRVLAPRSARCARRHIFALIVIAVAAAEAAVGLAIVVAHLPRPPQRRTSTSSRTMKH